MIFRKNLNFENIQLVRKILNNCSILDNYSKSCLRKGLKYNIIKQDIYIIKYSLNTYFILSKNDKELNKNLNSLFKFTNDLNKHFKGLNGIELK